MMVVNLPIKSNVPLMAPADSCCNCGSTDKVKMTDTDLRRMPAMGLAGAEIKIVLPFPYCKECVPSAKRRRPGALGILAINSSAGTSLTISAAAVSGNLNGIFAKGNGGALSVTTTGAVTGTSGFGISARNYFGGTNQNPDNPWVNLYPTKA